MAAASFDLDARDTGDCACRAPATVAARVSLLPAGRKPWGAIRFTAALICRMCSGVVPQHPPTSRTPFATNRRAYDAMYSGEHR